jgi:hypothetical protein
VWTVSRDLSHYYSHIHHQRIHERPFRRPCHRFEDVATAIRDCCVGTGIDRDRFPNAAWLTVYPFLLPGILSGSLSLSLVYPRHSGVTEREQRLPRADSPSASSSPISSAVSIPSTPLRDYNYKQFMEQLQHRTVNNEQIKATIGFAYDELGLAREITTLLTG